MSIAARSRAFLLKLRRLDAEQTLLLAEAMVLVTLAAPVVRWLPFRYIGRIASRRIRHAPLSEERRQRVVALVGWAVDCASKRSRLRSLCFERGLTAQVMLRRRAVDSTLYYGAAPGTSKALEAHVWVMDRQVGVMGAENANEFAVLAVFPVPGRADLNRLVGD